MKAILLGPESQPYGELLRTHLSTPWELVCFEALEPHSAAAPDFKTADALVSVRFNGRFPPMPALRLLQAPATGTNSIMLGAVPAAATVCNAHGHQIAVAEYAIMAMLACARDLVGVHERFVQGRWHAGESRVVRPYAEIFGKTVCILGLGRIGQEVAARCKALGMRVTACSRTTEGRQSLVDEMGGLGQLPEFAARADFVIVACELNDETRGIVDGRILGAMRPTAFIVNVGRGPLISEAALFDVLASGRIAGAALDVWYRYPDTDHPHPPPSQLPFHELDNVIMTPHVSGWTEGMLARRWAQIAANLDHLARGEPLVNVLRPARASSGVDS